MLTVASRRFSLTEIEDATTNFEVILGHGGESTVYLGQISGTGNVAVKKLKSNITDFQEEIDIVSKCKHPNLVSLHGYCDESNQKMLVYEYMEKGSLSNYLIKKKKTVCLSWQQRLNICLGAAYGLQYLHRERDELPKGIIHRDIKPDNILLDDNWVAKVSDFGMCKLSHDGQIKSTMVSLLKGTSGYYAPEYLRYGHVTRKIDVYAFGVVLFQVLCQKMPWDRDDESYYRLDDEDLGLWARENVDPEIYEEISEDCLEMFTHIIGRSLLQDPSARPTMDDVVIDLECALKCQECQDEAIRPKGTSSRRKVSIPGSVQKIIQNIKEMKITKNSEEEIYVILKECSMDPFQTIQKLLITGRISNETASERPESSSTITGDNDRGITMFNDLQQKGYHTGVEEFQSVLSTSTRYSQFRVIAEFRHEDLVHKTNIISSIEFDQDDEFFATAGVSRRIKVFEFSSIVNEQAAVQFPTAEILTQAKLSCLSWNKYSKSQIASSDYEGIVTVWDVTTCQSVKKYEEHEKRAWSVDYSCTEPSMIVSGGDDCKVKIWSTNQNASVLNIDMRANICSVKYNPGSSFHLAVGSADHDIYYYDLRNIDQPLYVLDVHRQAVSYVKFLSNYELASASTDSTLRLWDVTENKLLRTFRGHTNERNFVGLTVNSEYIVCGSETNEVFVYHKAISKPAAWHRFGSDSGEGEEDAEESNFVSTVCLKGDGPIMLSANSQGTIRVLELAA